MAADDQAAKVAPAAIAAAVVAALREGREEVVVGEIAKEIHAKWAEDPRLLRQESLSDAVTGAVTALAAFASAIADGRLRVIDLTQTLDPDFPTIVLPPELGQSQPFRIEEISHYDHRGPAWYWNNFSMGEHAGTHFDAPAHWVTGRDLPNGTVDAIDPKKFIAPACVIDCSAGAAADPDYLLETEGIEAWERAHGPIPKGPGR